jgi:hypothetical protein
MDAAKATASLGLASTWCSEPPARICASALAWIEADGTLNLVRDAIGSGPFFTH